MTNYSPVTQTPIDVSALDEASLSLQGYDSTQSGNAQLRRFSLTGIINKIFSSTTFTAIQTLTALWSQRVEGRWNSLTCGNGDNLLLIGSGANSDPIFSAVSGSATVSQNSIISLPAPSSGTATWEIFYGINSGIATSAASGTRGSYAYLHLGQSINGGAWTPISNDGEGYTGGTGAQSAEVINRFGHGFWSVQLSPGNTYQYRVMFSSNATAGTWTANGVYLRARRVS